MSTRRHGFTPRFTGKSENGRKVCRWCGKELPKYKQRWCSPECHREFLIRVSSAAMRGVVFERDCGVCAVCRVDTIAQRAEYKRRVDEHCAANGLRPYTAPWNEARWEILRPYGIPAGRLESDWWDADHIIPVSEGGGECGLDGLRTLCISCHRTATAELRTRMKWKRRQEAGALRQLSLIT